MASGKAFAESGLTFTVGIKDSRVKIIEPVIKKIVYHLRKNLGVYLSILHGKAHASKAEIFLYLRKQRHNIPPLVNLSKFFDLIITDNLSLVNKRP